MTLFWRLLGVQLNQRFGLSVLRAGFREQKARTIGRLALGVFVILSLGLLVGMYAWLVSMLLPAFQSLGMEQVLLGVVLLVAMVFVLFMGLFYLIGVLFFSRDTEFLAALPIPQSTVFAAKFSQVLLGELGTSLILLWPPFILYGIQAGVDGLYWLRMLIVTLFVPCIPLALAALLSLLLMRFSAIWRRRDLLAMIGSLLLVVVAILGQGLLTSRMPEDMDMNTMMALVSDSAAVLRTVVSAFPPSGWAAQALAGSWGMLALFAGVSLVSLAIVVWISGHLYYRSATTQLETADTRRRVSWTARTFRNRSALYALFRKEWRTVLRSPTYAMNGLISILVGPLLILFFRLIPSDVQNVDLSGMLSMASGLLDPALLLMVAAAMFLFIGLINPAVSTSLSREGQMFYLLRVIPVTPARQVMAKYLFGLSVAGLTMLLMGITTAIAFGISSWLMLAAFLLGLLACVAPIALSMLLDVLRPKLSWNSETEAIKQNFNSVVGMLIGWVYLFVLGFACYWLMHTGVSASVTLIVAAVICVVMDVVSVLLLTRAAGRSWQAIEG